MAYDLPLPRVVPDAVAGGPFLAALNALNKYRGNTYDTTVKEQQAEWAPYTVPAEAASKLAYAGLVGPQHILKLLNNPALLANLSEEDKRKLLELAKNGGLNAGNISDRLNPLARNDNGSPPQNAFVQNAPQQQGADQQNPNALNKYNVQNVGGVNALGNQALPMTPKQLQNMNGYYGNPPASLQEAARSAGIGTTFAENEGRYKGEVAQEEELGKEIGKGRGQQITTLNDELKGLGDQRVGIDNLANLFRSNDVRAIRQHPLLGSAELSLYKRGAIGTPAQQKLAGKLSSSLKTLVTSSFGIFPQRVTDRDISLLNSMKPSDSDTIDAMQGKLESLAYMNDMQSKRKELAINYMTNGRMSEADAFKRADKEVNGDAVRDAVQDKVYGLIPVMEVDDKDRPTGKTKMITAAEAREHGINLDNYSGVKKGAR